MQLRKIGAAALSTLMAGAGVVTPALASDLSELPSPFVKDGQMNSVIVVGADAKTADVAGAINIAARFASEVSQEATAEAGGAAQWSATDGASLNTVNRQLYIGDSINKARQTLTDDDLSLLADGTVSTDTTDYDYQQFLEVKSVTPGIAKGDGDDQLTDAALITEVPQNNPLYTAKVSFTKAFNATEAAEDSADIELFGKTYTFDSTSGLDGGSQVNNDNIVLFGSAQDLQISVGESASFTAADGTDHTISVSAVNADGVVYSVDNGDAKQKTTGYTFDVGDTTVKIDSKINLKDDSGSATFAIGSEKMTLDETNGEVQLGGEDVGNTDVTITEGSSNGEITEISIDVGAPNNDVDDIEAGDQFEDTAFGTFSYAFGGINPEFTADSRSNIDVTTSGKYAEVTMTGSAGNTNTLTFAKWASGPSFTVEDDTGNSYALVEGTGASESDYVVVDQGGFEHLLQVSNINIDGGADDEVTFEDVFTGADYSVSGDGLDGNGETMYIDGQSYTVKNTSTTEVSVTWDTSAKTVFPVLEDENGAKVALLSSDITDNSVNTVVNTTTSADQATELFNLPTGTLNVTLVNATSGADVLLNGNSAMSGVSDATTATNAVDVGTVTYSVNATVDKDGNGDSYTQATVNDINATTTPGLMVVEEEDDENNQNAAIVPVADGSDADDEMDIGSPGFTSSSQNGKLDNDDTIYADLYGTYAVSDASDDGESVNIYYPDNQATVGAGFVEEGGSLSATGGGTVTYQESVPVTNPVAKLDTEVTREAPENLILVGGPAVNTLVADLAANNKTQTREEYEEGEAFVQLVEDAFADGQTAMVVAGYSAADTTRAAAAVQTYDTQNWSGTMATV